MGKQEGDKHTSLTNAKISDVVRKYLVYANIISKSNSTGNHVISLFQTNQEIYRVAVGENTIRIQYEQL